MKKLLLLASFALLAGLTKQASAENHFPFEAHPSDGAMVITEEHCYYSDKLLRVYKTLEDGKTAEGCWTLLKRDHNIMDVMWVDANGHVTKREYKMDTGLGSYLTPLKKTAKPNPIFKRKELEYGFRGIILGTPFTQVALDLPQVFKNSNVMSDMMSVGMLALIVGDEKGVKNCNTVSGKACLAGIMAFTQKSLNQKLYLIDIEQTFPSPVTFNALKEKLQASYGTPVYVSSPKEIQYSSPAYSVTSFVWGGNKVPVGEYEATLSDDWNRIGGKFVTAKVYRVRGLVTGYKLSVADGDLLQENKPAVDKDFEAILKERQESSNKAIKF